MTNPSTTQLHNAMVAVKALAQLIDSAVEITRNENDEFTNKLLEDISLHLTGIAQGLASQATYLNEKNS